MTWLLVCFMPFFRFLFFSVSITVHLGVNVVLSVIYGLMVVVFCEWESCMTCRVFTPMAYKAIVAKRE